jgi:hypothetical protein
MSPTKSDALGSPRVFKAACIVFTSNEIIEMNDAMNLAGYKNAKFPAYIFGRVPKKIQVATSKCKKNKPQKISHHCNSFNQGS